MVYSRHDDGSTKTTYNCGATPMVWKAVFKKKRDIHGCTPIYGFLIWNTFF